MKTLPEREYRVSFALPVAMLQPTKARGRNPGRQASLSVLLFVCLIASGCPTTAVLTDAALAGCGTGTIYLSAWYSNVPDKSAINVDPMGGYQFAYWVDDAGNACHGDPGRNGQVGPVIIKAFRQQAFDFAINGSSITEEQLKGFQEIPTSFANYSASGSHFVQFINTLFRSRADGKAFRDSSSGTISIPTITEIGSKACTAPVAFRVTGTLFLPSPSAPGPPQDPTRCKVRALPATGTMSEADRKKYDVLTLPYGAQPVSVP